MARLLAFTGSHNSMNPLDISSFNHRTERLATGRTYHFVDQKPAQYDPRRSKTLLCVHGFPDFWYGWRYQINPWVLAGYRVVVPDMLGYGGTDKPSDPSEYSTKKLCEDLVALLDLLQIQKSVLVGHDWGAFTVARFALWYPDRLCALVIMNVPYTPPSQRYISVEEVGRLAPNLGYQADFADLNTNSRIEAQLSKFLSLTFAAPGKGTKYFERGALQKLLAKELEPPTSVLTKEEIALYNQTLKAGINGPLNYYRTSKFRFDEEKAAGLPSNLPQDLPVLFLWGTEDATCTPFVIGKAKKFIKRYQEVALEGKGHWILVEAKDEVTKKVDEWLQSLYSAKPDTQRHSKL